MILPIGDFLGGMVCRFAVRLQRNLNDINRNYRPVLGDKTNKYLLNRLEESVDELKLTIKNKGDVCSKAAEVATFAMMISDKKEPAVNMKVINARSLLPTK